VTEDAGRGEARLGDVKFTVVRSVGEIAVFANLSIRPNEIASFFEDGRS